MPPGWGKGLKSRTSLIFFLIFFKFSLMESFVFEQKYYLGLTFLSVTSDHRVQSFRVGLGVKI